ncbi:MULTISPECIES: hypothetical protein [unclassified Leptospira]|uniref:hypothetical protein n=1 Tax=unclassified Leptospira TaxID=2633828 RepID=UPI000292838F|nr:MULTISPECIES: hypothetical protein [unclassified Leptospira]EKO76891.1 hypothetical protein LEP1GSC068_1738 [Leptospira sp. Fiocruz LV3954]EMI67144.1 hypothetical protein LEP1GSC076_1466 [Leptospira sp. Fiocruz LV4135]
MPILIPVLILISYFLIRKIWFHLRKIRTIAGIEKISLCVFYPDLFLPEVRVFYKYYFQGGIYYGSGYMLLTDFLGQEEYSIYRNADGLPVLEMENQVVLSEEQIEHFLMQKYPSIIVYIDPVEPFHSLIDCINAKSMSMTA